MLTHSAKHKRS